ncbi:MAG: oligosaccharide flippase family protein [Planctomycetaceae bacterium]|nr:oligosaccharide flippase family protein [Planctomycetaceae bacterium]
MNGLTSRKQAGSPPSRRPSFLSQIGRSVGMRASSAGLTFLLGLVCARALGLEGYGEFAIAVSWMNILVVVGKLGFDTAALRYVAQYRSQGEMGLLAGFVRTSRRLVVAASLLIASGWIGLTILLADNLTPGLSRCLLLAALMLPLIAAIQLREATLLASGRIMAGQLGGVMLPLVLMLLMGAAGIFSEEKLTSAGVLVLNIASAVLTLAVLASRSNEVNGDPVAMEQPRVRVQEWLVVAWPLLFVQLLNLLQNQSGTIMCGFLLNKEAAGLFAAVSRIASVLFLGLQAIGTIAAPTIAAMHHSGRRDEMERYVRRCAVASFGFAAAFALLMLVAGRSVLGLFGEEFLAGYVPMTAMLVGLALGAAAGPVNYVMMMTGHQWDCIKVYGVVTVLGLALGWFVIPAYGVLGAALIAALGRMAAAWALVWYAYQRHGLWSIALPVRAAVRAADELPRAAA